MRTFEVGAYYFVKIPGTNNGEEIWAIAECISLESTDLDAIEEDPNEEFNQFLITGDEDAWMEHEFISIHEQVIFPEDKQ